MSTGFAVMDTLTKHVIAMCDRSIENAKLAGRKTVFDSNFPALDNR